MKKHLLSVLTIIALFMGAVPHGAYAQGALSGIFRGATRRAGAGAAGKTIVRVESRVATESLTGVTVRTGGTWASRGYGRASYPSVTWGDPVAAHGQGSFARAQIGPMALTIRSAEGGSIRTVVRPGARVTKESIVNSMRLVSPSMSKTYARSMVVSSVRLVGRTSARTRGALARANIGSNGATISGRTKGAISITKPSAVASGQTSWWRPGFVGRGSTANSAKFTFQPRNLYERRAIELAKSSPAAGNRVRGITMSDPRWRANKGWVKMQQIVKVGRRPVNVHYVRNILTGEYDDFKIVEPKPRQP